MERSGHEAEKIVSAPRAAPPTTRPRVRAERKQPAWPGAVGITLIAVGWAGIVPAVWGLLSAVWFAMQGVPPVKGVDIAKAHAMMLPVTISNGLVMFVLGAVLIVGGFGMANRRAWGMPVLLVWAMVRVAAVVLMAAWSVRVQERLFAEMGGASVVTGGEITRYGALFEFMVTALVPLFVIVWFCLPGVRAEVRRWRDNSNRSLRSAHGIK